MPTADPVKLLLKNAAADTLGCGHGRYGSGIRQLEVRAMMEERTGTVSPPKVRTAKNLRFAARWPVSRANPGVVSPPTLRTVNNFKLALWEGEVRSLLRTDSRTVVTTQNAYGEEFYAHGTVTSEASKPRAASPPSLRTANNFQPGSWEGEVRSSF